MKCEDCEVLTKVMINCEGCPYVVCQSCYDHRHSGHRVKEIWNAPVKTKG